MKLLAHESHLRAHLIELVQGSGLGSRIFLSSSGVSHVWSSWRACASDVIIPALDVILTLLLHKVSSSSSLFFSIRLTLQKQTSKQKNRTPNISKSNKKPCPTPCLHLKQLNVAAGLQWVPALLVYLFQLIIISNLLSSYLRKAPLSNLHNAPLSL